MDLRRRSVLSCLFYLLNNIHLWQESTWELLSTSGILLDQNIGTEIDLSAYNAGIFLVKIGGQVVRVVKE